MTKQDILVGAGVSLHPGNKGGRAESRRNERSFEDFRWWGFLCCLPFALLFILLVVTYGCSRNASTDAPRRQVLPDAEQSVTSAVQAEEEFPEPSRRKFVSNRLPMHLEDHVTRIYTHSGFCGLVNYINEMENPSRREEALRAIIEIANDTGFDIGAISECINGLDSRDVKYRVLEALLNASIRKNRIAARALINALPRDEIKLAADILMKDVYEVEDLLELAPLFSARIWDYIVDSKFDSIGFIGNEQAYLNSILMRTDISNEKRSPIVNRLLRSWSEEDPRSVAAFIDGIPDRSQVWFDIKRRIAISLAKDDPAQAMDWIQSIDNEVQYNIAASAVLSEAAKRSPEEAMTYAINNYDSFAYPEDVLMSVLESWITKDTAEAVAWVWSLESEHQELYQKAVGAVSYELNKLDVKAAGDFLNELAYGDAKDGLVGEYAQTIAPEYPKTAVMWASTIGDPAERLRRVRDVFPKWYNVSPQDASAWAREANLTKELIVDE